MSDSTHTPDNLTQPRSVLNVRNLSIEFDIGTTSPLVAVDDISFKIDPDEIFCLVGESGSGKSVTSLAAMKLIPRPPGRYTGGIITLSGDSPGKPATHILTCPPEKLTSIRGNRVAMIFQEPMTALNPVLTIGEQITEAILLHTEISEDDARTQTIELLKQVRIDNADTRIDEYPHRMSGGQRQRVMIAMALACEPDLLIADEPTTALDVTVQAEILDLMRALQRKHHTAILFITHDFAVVATIADRVAVMHKGKIVETGTTREIIDTPKHPYTQKLIASLPQNLEKPENTNTPADKNSPPLLSLHNLKVHFPIRSGLLQKTTGHIKAVDGVSITIMPGEILALVGESGCGKTTLGRAILQLIRPTSGDVTYDDTNLTKLNRVGLRRFRRDLQIVFQDPFSSLNPRLRVGDAIAEPLIAHGLALTRHEAWQTAATMLKRVHLDADMLHRYPHEFSGGQRQRIGIARCLVLTPKFIVCDEITSALDVSVQASVLKLLLELRNQYNLSFLFITHNIGVVEYIADRVAVMHAGKIVEKGETHEVLTNPRHDYTRHLLSAVPRI